MILEVLTNGSASEAWRTIIDKVIEITSEPLNTDTAIGAVINRDSEVGMLDHFLTSSGWDLWQDFGESVERTSDRLIQWWANTHGAKALLILDGLSLREMPWLLQGAKEHGFALHEVTATASELPGETNEFARALGLGGRSQLQNNGGGGAHKLQPTRTECVDMPWKDCKGLIDVTPNWFFWHHWPDKRVHEAAGAGQGLETLTKDAAAQLSSDDFWAFVERLAIGRRLVLTSDHGYAATGYFHDADGEVGQFLKKAFSGGRNALAAADVGPFVPPVALEINGPHGAHILALGRRKWRSPGGYPTLTHGGLSLLEVLSPFIELTK
jgi:hypothetical protein